MNVFVNNNVIMINVIRFRVLCEIKKLGRLIKKTIGLPTEYPDLTIDNGKFVCGGSWRVKNFPGVQSLYNKDTTNYSFLVL